MGGDRYQLSRESEIEREIEDRGGFSDRCFSKISQVRFMPLHYWTSIDSGRIHIIYNDRRVQYHARATSGGRGRR